MKNYSKAEMASIIKSATPKPRLELSESQINSLKTTSDILLAIVGVAGLVMLSMAAPNAMRALKSFYGKSDKRHIPFKERQKKLGRAFYYLKEKEYIKLKQKAGDLEIEVTEKGKKKIDQLKLDLLQIKKPLIWDRKFWQVAADIPVLYKKEATVLRGKLKQMGFYSLQRSLWIYPYDPRKEIELLTKEYKIDRFVTVMKIAKLDYADHKVLMEYFQGIKVVEF